jgi:hypothetical protein
MLMKRVIGVCTALIVIGIIFSALGGWLLAQSRPEADWTSSC